jgi:hypothetical protein
MINAPVIEEKEMRRVNGIRFLAKVNPVKYDARYVNGRLELFYNVVWKVSIGYGQMYLWQKQKT